MSINKVFIQGNLTKDIEIRQSKAGKSWASFSLGVNKKVEEKQITYYATCKVFGKQADKLFGMLKGEMVFVEGELATESWEKDGVKKYKDIIIVHSLIVPKFNSVAENNADVAGGNSINGVIDSAFNDDEIVIPDGEEMF